MADAEALLKVEKKKTKNLLKNQNDITSCLDDLMNLAQSIIVNSGDTETDANVIAATSAAAFPVFSTLADILLKYRTNICMTVVSDLEAVKQ